MIKLAGDILQDINGLVIKNRCTLARKTSQEEMSNEDLIKQWAIFLLQGVDFSQDQVFQTLHPYPLGDSHQKEQFFFPGALGINFQYDSRSRVENNSDNLHLDSSANHDNTNLQIDNNLKTTYSLVSKSSVDKEQIRFTLGPKVNIDFYGRNPVNQVRNNMNEVRWGYKLYLRPLYGERILVRDQIMPQKDDKSSSQDLQKLLNLSRSFSNLINLIRISNGFLISGYGLDKLGVLTQKSKQAKNAVEALKKAQNDQIVKSDRHRQFLDWYLFKGGMMENKSQDECLDDLIQHLTHLRTSKIILIDQKMKKLMEKRNIQKKFSREQQKNVQKAKKISKKEKAKRKKAIEEQNQAQFVKNQIQGEEKFKKIIQKRRQIFNFKQDGSIDQDRKLIYYKILKNRGSLPHQNSKLRRYVDDLLLNFNYQCQKDQLQQGEFVGHLHTIIRAARQIQPYRQNLLVEKMLETFSLKLQSEWQRMEMWNFLCSMYHSSIDIEKLAKKCQELQVLKKKVVDNLDEQSVSQLKILAIASDKLFDWMILRVRSEKELHNLSKQIIDWRNEITEAYIFQENEKKVKKIKAQQEDKKAKDQALNELQAQNKKSGEEKKKVDQDEDQAKKQQDLESFVKVSMRLKKKNQVSVVKTGPPRSSKKKVHRNFASMKKGTAQKKSLKANAESGSITSSIAGQNAPNSQVQSTISESDNDVGLIEQVGDLIKDQFFTLRDKQLQQLKERIHNGVYSRFLQYYQSDVQRAISLCRVVDEQFDPENPNTSLSIAFKYCKRSILSDIDAGGGHSLLNRSKSRLKRKVDPKSVDQILPSPYEVVAKHIQRRALFLLLLKPTSELEQQVKNGLSKEDFTSLALTRGDSLNLNTLDVELIGNQSSWISGSSIINRNNQAASTTRRKNQEGKKNIQINFTPGPLASMDFQSKHTHPAYSCSRFLTSFCDLRGLKRQFQQQRRRAALRRAGLQFNQATIQLCKNTPFTRRALGQISQKLHNSCLQEIGSSGIDMLIKLNQVSLQTSLNYMQNINRILENTQEVRRAINLSSNAKQKSSEKSWWLNSNKYNFSQYYSAIQPDILTIVTQINEITVLFEHKFTKEFLFQILNEASQQIGSSIENYLLNQVNRSDNRLLVDEIQSISTDDGSHLVRFQSSSLLSEQTIQLRRAQTTRCSDLSQMFRTFVKFTLNLNQIVTYSDHSSFIPAKMYNILKHSSIILLDLLIGSSDTFCKKLTQIVYLTIVDNLQQLRKESVDLTDMKVLEQIDSSLDYVSRVINILSQDIDTTILKDTLLDFLLRIQSPLIIRKVVQLGRLLNLKTDASITAGLFKKIGRLILPDVYESSIRLCESITKKRRHHVLVHINAPSASDYSFVFLALYHWEQYCLKMIKPKSEQLYQNLSLLRKDESYQTIKTVNDLKNLLPDKILKKRPKLKPQKQLQEEQKKKKQTQVKKAEGNRKVQQRKKRQDFAQDLANQNMSQGLQTLRLAFSEYMTLFQQPIYTRDDSAAELQRKIDMYNWNLRMLTHIKQAQRLQALLHACGLVDFCDVHLSAKASNYSFIGQNIQLLANAVLNSYAKKPQPMDCEYALIFANIIRDAFKQDLPRVTKNPFFNHWRNQKTNTKDLKLNFNKQGIDWIYPLQAKLTQAQEQAIKQAVLQDYDDKQQLRPRKISLAQPNITVSLADQSLQSKIEEKLRQNVKLNPIELDSNQNSLQKLSRNNANLKFDGANDYSLFIKQDVEWPQNAALITQLTSSSSKDQKYHQQQQQQQQNSFQRNSYHLYYQNSYTCNSVFKSQINNRQYIAGDNNSKQNTTNRSYYTNSQLTDIDKKKLCGFKQCLETTPIDSGQSSSILIQQIIQYLNSCNSDIDQDIKIVIKMLSNRSWRNKSQQQQFRMIGILTTLSGWFFSPFKGLRVIHRGKPYVVAQVSGNKVKLISSHDQKEFVVDKSQIQQERQSDYCKKIQPNDLLKALSGFWEDFEKQSKRQGSQIEGILLTMLLKIAKNVNWQKLTKKLRASLVSLLMKISKQSKKEVSQEITDDKLLKSWERMIDKFNLSLHMIFEASQLRPEEMFLEQQDESQPQLQDQKEINQAANIPSSSSQLKLISNIDQDPQKQEQQQQAQQQEKKSSSLILGYALPESEYIVDLPKTQQNVTNQVGLRLLHYWEKTLIPRTVQYCASFPIQVLTNSIAQVRVPLRMGDITNATESILILLDRKVPNGCIIPSFNHDWNSMIAQQIQVGGMAKARLIGKDTDFFDSSHHFLERLFKQQQDLASSNEDSKGMLKSQIPVFILKFDQKLNAALCGIIDQEFCQMYTVWIGCGNLYPLDKNQLRHVSCKSVPKVVNEVANSVTNLNSLYAQKILLQLFYEGQKIQEKDNPMLSLIKKSVQIQLSGKSISGWAANLEPELPLRLFQQQKDKKIEQKEQKTDPGSFQEINKLILNCSSSLAAPKSPKSDLKIDQTISYLQLFKQHLVSEASLKQIWQLGQWCIQQWQDHKSSNKSTTLNIRQAHQLQARTPEHQMYRTKKLIRLHSEQHHGAGVILVFQKDAYLSANSKLSFYSDPDRVNQIFSVQAGRTDKLLEPLVFDSGRVWCDYIPGSLALLTQVEQRNPRKSQLPCTVVTIPQSWPTCCWLTQHLISAIVYKIERINKNKNQNLKEAAVCGLQLSKKLIGSLCSYYEVGSSPAQIVQLLFKLISRLVHKVRFFKSIVYGVQQNEKATQALEELGIQPKWLIQVAKNMNTLIKKNRSTLTPPLIQDGVQLIVAALVSSSKDGKLIKYQELDQEDAKLYPWLRASIDTACFLDCIIANKQKKGDKRVAQKLKLPEHIQNQIKESQFLNHAQLMNDVFFVHQQPQPDEEEKEKESQEKNLKQKDENEKEKEDKKEQKKEDKREEKKEEDNQKQPQDNKKSKQNPPEQKRQKVKIYLTPQQIRQTIISSITKGHAKLLNTQNDILVKQSATSNKLNGMIVVNGWDFFYDQQQEGPDTLDDDSDIDKDENWVEDEGQNANLGGDEQDEEGWSCPQCTFINSMEELTCIICGQGMRPAVQAVEEVVEENQGDEDLKLNNQIIEMETKQRLRTKRRRKVFLEVLQQALVGKAKAKIAKWLEEWKKVQDARVKALYEQQQKKRKIELEKRLQEQQKEKEKKKSQEQQNQGQIKKQSNQKPEDKKQVKKQKLSDDLPPIKIDRNLTPQCIVPEFKALCFADAKSDKQLVEILKQRFDKMIAPGQEEKKQKKNGLEKISEQIYISLTELDQENITLPKLIDTQIVQKHQLSTWDSLRKIKSASILHQKLLNLKDQDISQLLEFLCSMGYDLHLNQMHFLKLPKDIPHFSIRKLKLLRHLVQDRICRETKSVYCLRGVDFFIPRKSKCFDWDSDQMKKSDSIPPLGHYNDKMFIESFSVLDSFNLMTFRYNWALLKNFNTKLLSSINLIKVKAHSNEIQSNNQIMTSMELGRLLTRCRGVAFSNIKRDLIQDAIKKTQVNLERRSKLEFQRLKLAESLMKPSQNAGEQNQQGYSKLVSEMKNKHLPSDQTSNQVRMLLAIEYDQNASGGDQVKDNEELKQVQVKKASVISQNIQLSRDMSDWANNQLNKKKTARQGGQSNQSHENNQSPLFGGGKKSSSKNLFGLFDQRKREAQNEAEDESQSKNYSLAKQSGNILDPFLQLDSRIYYAENLMQGGKNYPDMRSSKQTDLISKSKEQDLTMFIQAFKQVSNLDLSNLRAAKVKGTTAVSFDVVFRGQDVAGEGGPYRQFFADLSAELQPSKGKSQVADGINNNNNNQEASKNSLLTLLIPTPNNRDEVQDSKDKYIINPKQQSSVELYEFLGILMGCCIRTGVHLTLNLPALFWKMLTGQRIMISDFEEVDVGFTRQIKTIIRSKNQEQIDIIYQNYSVKSVDGVNDILLMGKNDVDQVLKFKDKTKFVEAAIVSRLQEIKQQCIAIRNGISKLMPAVMLNLTTWRELQSLICGKTKVDIDLLQRHTKYSGGLKEDSPRVIYFWKTLREMSDEDLLRFVKFCWGQERLPANDEEFIRARVRFMIKPTIDGSHGDNALPKADTCFFNLQLPNYSSQDILKQKLLLAIYFDCDSMNAENAAVQDLNEPEAYDGEEE